jgi:hypothetical protein
MHHMAQAKSPLLLVEFTFPNSIFSYPKCLLIINFVLDQFSAVRRSDLGGAILFTASATFGYDQMCSFAMKTYLANNATTIVVGNHTISLSPRSVKYSIAVNCPWEALLAKNRSETLVAGAYNYITRRSGPMITPTIEMHPALALNRLGPQIVSQDIDQPGSFQVGSEWENTRCNAYLTGVRFDGANRLRGLWPLFDFVRDVLGVRISFDSGDNNYTIFNRYNGWAYADNSKDSRADWLDSNIYFNLPSPEVLAEDLYRYRIPFTMVMEFVDSVLYDPSLDLLFIDNSAPPIGADSTPEQIATNNQIIAENRTGIIIGVVVGVVLLGAFVALGLLVWKNAKFRTAIMPFSQRKAAIEDTLDDAEEAAPALKAGGDNRKSVWIEGRASVSTPQ